MSQIELKTIRDLFGKKFFIPKYQRGYRWTRTQVNDLLEDIKEFMEPQSNGDSGALNEEQTVAKPTQANDFYCIQPLVVSEAPSKDFRTCIQHALEAENDNAVLRDVRKVTGQEVQWEVIDGQQRLTTIFLILGELGLKNPFDMKYARWGGMQSTSNLGTKVENLEENDESNIDSFHLCNAEKTIKAFFSRYSLEEKIAFRNILENKVQFIWYESVDEDPIKVFTRLNIGKIGLTNSELIKALLLSRVNFGGNDWHKIRLRQQEIAARWDEIEATLQDDEFWMFLHVPGFEKPTRIDFLFDLICDMKGFDEYIKEEKRKDDVLGRDEYRTFRYFHAFFHSDYAKINAKDNGGNKALLEVCWKKVDTMFATFKEWFDDLRLYHYVGYLIAVGVDIKDLLVMWRSENEKERFLGKIITKIKEKIKNCKDLDKQYEIGGNDPKSCCRPLLLLHNIQSAINQNVNETEKYGTKAFYKFPFHLFKSEKWNVEHIDSNTENSLGEQKDREAWLKSAWLFIGDADSEAQEMKKRILEYFQPSTQNREELFEQLYIMVSKNIDAVNPDPMDESRKNMIGNFVLLDEHTNKSYGNAIFPMKKLILLGKAQGVEWQISEDCDGDVIVGFRLKDLSVGSIQNAKKPQTAFVPTVTLQAFLKAYNPLSNNPYSWDGKDSEKYVENIFDTLKDFGVTKGEVAK